LLVPSTAATPANPKIAWCEQHDMASIEQWAVEHNRAHPTIGRTASCGKRGE